MRQRVAYLLHVEGLDPDSKSQSHGYSVKDFAEHSGAEDLLEYLAGRAPSATTAALPHDNSTRWVRGEVLGASGLSSSALQEALVSDTRRSKGQKGEQPKKGNNEKSSV